MESNIYRTKEELLSLAVQKFPCLYDKRYKDYKNQVVRENAWTAVAREVGLETAGDAAARWISLKARYTRQRKIAHSLEKSGMTIDEAKEVKRTLDIYHILSWLDQFVPSRRRRSNTQWRASLVEQSLKCNTRKHTGHVANNYENELNRKTLIDNMENDDDLSIEIVHETEPHGRRSIPINESVSTPPIREPSLLRDDRKLHQSQREIDCKLMNGFVTPKQDTSDHNRNQILINHDEDDLYGALIASQLKKLTEDQKLQAKHEIDNVLYKIRMDAFKQSAAQQQGITSSGGRKARGYNQYNPYPVVSSVSGSLITGRKRYQSNSDHSVLIISTSPHGSSSNASEISDCNSTTQQHEECIEAIVKPEDC